MSRPPEVGSAFWYSAKPWLPPVEVLTRSTPDPAGSIEGLAQPGSGAWPVSLPPVRHALPGHPAKVRPSPPATHADGSLTALPVNVSTVSVSAKAGTLPTSTATSAAAMRASLRAPDFERLPTLLSCREDPCQNLGVKLTQQHRLTPRSQRPKWAISTPRPTVLKNALKPTAAGLADESMPRLGTLNACTANT